MIGQKLKAVLGLHLMIRSPSMHLYDALRNEIFGTGRAIVDGERRDGSGGLGEIGEQEVHDNLQRAPCIVNELVIIIRPEHVLASRAVDADDDLLAARHGSLGAPHRRRYFKARGELSEEVAMVAPVRLPQRRIRLLFGGRLAKLSLQMQPKRHGIIVGPSLFFGEFFFGDSDAGGGEAGGGGERGQARRGQQAGRSGGRGPRGRRRGRGRERRRG